MKFLFFRLASDPPCHRKDKLDIPSPAFHWHILGIRSLRTGGVHIGLEHLSACSFVLCPHHKECAGKHRISQGSPQVHSAHHRKWLQPKVKGFLPGTSGWLQNLKSVFGRCTDEIGRPRRISSHIAVYMCQMSHNQHSYFLSLQVTDELLTSLFAQLYHK